VIDSLARYQQQQGVGGKTGVSDEPDTTKEVDLTRAHSLRCDDSIARQALQRMPQGHRGRAKRVNESVEFNAPLDTIQVISEADTPWQSCTSPIQ